MTIANEDSDLYYGCRESEYCDASRKMRQGCSFVSQRTELYRPPLWQHSKHSVCRTRPLSPKRTRTHNIPYRDSITQTSLSSRTSERWSGLSTCCHMWRSWGSSRYFAKCLALFPLHSSRIVKELIVKYWKSTRKLCKAEWCVGQETWQTQRVNYHITCKVGDFLNVWPCFPATSKG